MIKYHDNKNGEQYGADHHLTNNWNPDMEYADNEYVNVYFRIDIKGYDYSRSYLNEQTKFDKAVEKVFKALGWKCKEEHHNGVCATWINGKEHLYMHPRSFSGEVKKINVKEIAEMINSSDILSIEWVDLYETAYDISDEEYEKYLSSKSKDIKSFIIENAKTPRRNKFKHTSEVLGFVANKVKLRRVGIDDGRYSGGIGKTSSWIGEKILPALIKEGYIISNGYYIRTINKSEAKKKKLVV